MSETPETSGTLSSYSEGTSTHLVLCLGAGETAAALVQCVVARVTADGGLTRGYATGAGQGLAETHAEICGSNITFIRVIMVIPGGQEDQ